VGYLLGGYWLWLGLGVILVVPFFGDWLLPEYIEGQDAKYNVFYNLSLYLNFPLLIVANFVLAWLLSSSDPFSFGHIVITTFGYDLFAVRDSCQTIDYVLAMVGMGYLYGIAGTNISHELAHRQWSAPAQHMSRLLSAFTADGAFPVEHVYGHHRRVATYDDPATARRGESSWQFVWRSTIQSFRNAMAFETKRLKKKGCFPYSLKNRVIQGNLFFILYFLFYLYMAGFLGGAALILMSVYGKMQLELINYIEHYGIVRVPGEPVLPRHSWNSNHYISIFLLYNLPRHSHHHETGHLPFWKLNSYSEAPHLPYGYLTMILLAMVPPLFQRVMIPEVNKWDEHYATEGELALAKQANERSGYTLFSKSS